MTPVTLHRAKKECKMDGWIDRQCNDSLQPHAHFSSSAEVPDVRLLFYAAAGVHGNKEHASAENSESSKQN